MNNSAIKRKIYFYKAEAHNIENDQIGSFDLLKASFNAISQMPYDEDGRYQKVSSYKDVSCEVISFTNSMIKGKIGYRRTGDLPLKELRGKVSPVGLVDGESLFEPTHFIFFNTGILGVEYNHFGPRTGTLKNYILEKCDDIDKFLVHFLLKNDVSGIVTSISDVYEVDIVAYADNLDSFAELDTSLHRGLKAMRRSMPQSQKIKFQVSRNANSKNGMDVRWLSKLPTWLGKPQNHQVVERLRIRAVVDGDSKAKTHDLLEDKFVRETTIIKQDQNTLAVDTSNMLNEITRAYNELRGDLLHAF